MRNTRYRKLQRTPVSGLMRFYAVDNGMLVLSMTLNSLNRSCIHRTSFKTTPPTHQFFWWFYFMTFDSIQNILKVQVDHLLNFVLLRTVLDFMNESTIFRHGSIVISKFSKTRQYHFCFIPYILISDSFIP